MVLAHSTWVDSQSASIRKYKKKKALSRATYRRVFKVCINEYVNTGSLGPGLRIQSELRSEADLLQLSKRLNKQLSGLCG